MMTIDEAIKEGGPCTETTWESEWVDLALDTMKKYQQLEDFARWVAKEIIDEDMWEYNHLSFAELACRKLVKLGIMQESNGKYLYEEGEDDDD